MKMPMKSAAKKPATPANMKGLPAAFVKNAMAKKKAAAKKGK